MTTATASTEPINAAPNADGTENVVIIGSGPAGWTAAIYAARAELHPLVFPGRAQDKDLVPGGQLMLTTDVENYPGFPNGVTGPEMMHMLYHQAMRFDTRVVTDDGVMTKDELPNETLYQTFQNVAEVDLSQRPFTIKGDNGYEGKAHSIIIATGAKAKWLGLENEYRLAQAGGGVSACAVCDGALPMFRDQPLGVVGGGDTAVEEASYLAKFASRVHMFVRRDELRASKIMADRALNNDKITIHWNTEVVDVLGDDKVTGVKLLHNNYPEGSAERNSELELKGLFMAIGHEPITHFLNGQVETDDVGYLKLKHGFHSCTSVDGVFAAGDVADSHYRQAITAAGMGCKAAMDAEHYLATLPVAG
ncbi:MAG: FAD-dependent oxidoreductase [Planctomycetota bacterium]